MANFSQWLQKPKQEWQQDWLTYFLIGYFAITVLFIGNLARDIGMLFPEVRMDVVLD